LPLLLIALVAATVDRRASALLAVAVLALLALAASRLSRHGLAVRALRVLEAFVATGAGALSSDSNPLVGYVLAPAFMAGLSRGVGEALLVTLLGGGAGLLVDGLVGNEDIGHEAADAMQWLALAIAAGLLASWVRRLQAEAPDRDESYAEAYRLLTQLRTISRTLPAGLDVPTLAESLLDSVRAVLPFDRGAVLARSHGERLQPLALAGTDRLTWDIDLAEAGPLAEAWASQRAQVRQQPLGGRRRGHSVVVPLRVGMRTVAVLGLEWDDAATHRTVAAMPQVEQLATEAALRLETALLFDDVRSVATSEERRRLAREIHDGIAQELASLGYAIDAVVAEVSPRDAATGDVIRSLRRKVTGLVGELRMSIFDLRSEVDQHGGLGAALSEYVRAVGASTRLTVHLSLDEGPLRLPAAVEAELLRIAQEAITNARRHADAQNLWVTCSIDPPTASLRVEDDGEGLGPARKDSYGIEIMRERAARLRAKFDITARRGGGTCVEVRLGKRLARGASLSDPDALTSHS
jgi:signal transduction histidine kinase